MRSVRALVPIRTLLVLAALSADSCAPRARPLPHLDRGPGPNAGSDPLGAALHRDVVARSGMLEEVGAMQRGVLGADGAAERALLLEAGYCYALFAHADPSVGELRLRLMDSNRDPRQLDRERGAAATLGLDDPICPEPTGEFSLELRGEHGGAYAYRVFRSLAL